MSRCEICQRAYQPGAPRFCGHVSPAAESVRNEVTLLDVLNHEVDEEERALSEAHSAVAAFATMGPPKHTLSDRQKARRGANQQSGLALLGAHVRIASATWDLLESAPADGISHLRRQAHRRLRGIQ